jgi:hypothetical protein
VHLPTPTSVEVAVSPAAALAAVGEAAEMWGGAFQAAGQTGGDLELPVQAGLRRGRATVQVKVTPYPGGSTVAAHPVAVDYQLHGPAVAVLLVAAGGCAALLAWPFFPGLTAAVPLSILLVLGAWFLVVSRLQNRGVEEFLATVEAVAAGSG